MPGLLVPMRGRHLPNVPAFPDRALQASELAYAQQMAAAHAGSDIRDAVIVVPPYWGAAPRRALLDAAEIAGINVLGLMASHAAAALQYGIERDFSNRTESVVLFDVASHDVVAALVDYSAYAVKGSPKQRSQFRVRDVAYREGVGANRLDALLVSRFARQVRSASIRDPSSASPLVPQSSSARNSACQAERDQAARAPAPADAALALSLLLRHLCSLTSFTAPTRWPMHERSESSAGLSAARKRC